MFALYIEEYQSKSTHKIQCLLTDTKANVYLAKMASSSVPRRSAESLCQNKPVWGPPRVGCYLGFSKHVVNFANSEIAFDSFIDLLDYTNIFSFTHMYLSFRRLLRAEG